MVEHLVEAGNEVAVINYRGLADAELTSPSLYCADCWRDILDPMKHIYAKFVKGRDRKVFAIGFSMGANILANLLGHITDGSHEGEIEIHGACVV